MKPKSKYERKILDSIRALTDQVEIQRTRNGHIKVIFEGLKRKASVIFGGSPSCHRAQKNAMSEVRKAMALCEIEPREA